MKTARAMAMGIVLLSAFALPACDQHGHEVDRAGAHVKYTCSMHPFYISDKPGNCPICGMRLVPVHGDSAASGSNTLAGARSGHGDGGIEGYAAVQIDAEGQRRMGLSLVPVRRDPENGCGRTGRDRSVPELFQYR